MDQTQPNIRKPLPRQVAGVSMRLAGSLVLAFAGMCLAAVPFLIQFAKTCPNLSPDGTIWEYPAFHCSEIATAIHTFNTPGFEFIGWAALAMAMVAIVRKRRQQIAARREME